MASVELSREEFARVANVSRETMPAFLAYADHLVKWQASLNLVSRRSLDDLWRRHMLDSVQLVPLLPKTGTIVDIGAGAGFPALPVSLAANRPVRLVESDARKCAFLREAVRLTGADAAVVNARIESIEVAGEKNSVDIIVARALAPLSILCEMADSLRATTCVFLKGGRWQDELTEAEKAWKMRVETFESLTEPDARILRITDLALRTGGN
ncbi:MAG: 16S rRNA (guanine(527)-N(7))-methyltransferase RsmG [Rickettsiales bacterium]